MTVEQLVERYVRRHGGDTGWLYMELDNGNIRFFREQYFK